MVNENNIPKTETIYELKNEVPSYEEFMKTYKSSGETDILAEAEYQDQVLHGPQYGPGNSNSRHRAPSANAGKYPNWGRTPSSSSQFTSASQSTGFIIETYLKASAAAVITTATGGLAPVVGGAMWIGGELLQSTNADFLKFAGSKVKSIGSGTFFGGIFASSAVGEVAKNNGISLEDLEWFYEAKGSTETIYAVGKHGDHRNRGISYDSSCEVCNRNS